MTGPRRSLRSAAASLAVLSLLVFALAVEAEEPKRPREMVVQADFDIGADGQVTSVAVRTQDVHPHVVELVTNAARGWRFEPVLVDGVPAPVRTRASIKLRAEPVEAGYLLAVRGIGFGSRASATTMTPPQYPRAQMRQGIDAAVQLLVEHDAEGRVTDVRIISTAIGGATNERARARHAAEFEKAAKKAALTWRFDVDPEVAGGQVDPALWIPVEFVISGNPLALVEGRSEVTREILDRVADTPRTGSGPIALETQVRLKHDVVGTTL